VSYLDEDNVCTGFGETKHHGLPDSSGAASDKSRVALEGE
jgi:hypothetical protein